MRCPKCDSIIKERRCDICNKYLEDIYMEAAGGDEKKTLKMLHELIESTDSEEERYEIEKAIRIMQSDKIENKIESDRTDYRGVKVEKQERDIYRYIKHGLVSILVVIALMGVAEFAKKIYYSTMGFNNNVIKERKLDVAFLFHINQGNYDYSDIANRTCYKNLIKTLRNHRKLKFNIHISGTLIQDLKWYDKETIELIKEGVQDGQFEILGSTYSQNIMYSTSETSNRWQIEKHKELIKNTFGVEPTGFWNAERTWKQNLGKLMVDYGYKYTFIEDLILARNGTLKSEYALRTTENGRLVIVNDDKDILQYFNEAIDAGDYDEKKIDRGGNLKESRKEYKLLMRYLRSVYEKDKDDNFLLSYEDDGEITGLWDFEAGSDYNYDFQNLNFILTKFENTSWINIAKYSDVIAKNKAQEDKTPIKDGAAFWMEKDLHIELKDISTPNDMYTNWIDFNNNSLRLKYYRDIFRKYENFIKKYENNSNDNVRNIIKGAKLNLISHEYEFGCIGVGVTESDWRYGKREGIWENVKSISVAQDIIRTLETGKQGIYEKDVNDDGIEEVVVIKGKNYYVFSKARGGRLLFWYNIEKGIELCGAEISEKLGEQYYDGNFPVQVASFGDDVRFKNGDSDFLEYIKNKKYYIKHKALNEIVNIKKTEKEMEFAYDKESDTISDNIFNAEMKYKKNSDNEIEFSFYELNKKIVFNDSGFDVEYTISGDLKNMIISSEFEPDYFNVVDNGLESLITTKEAGKIKIENKNTGYGVEVEYPKETEVSEEDALFGKVVIFNTVDKNFRMKVRGLEGK